MTGLRTTLRDGVLLDASVGVGLRTPSAAATCKSAEVSQNTPLTEARLLNVQLVTELRELKQKMDDRRWQSMEIAAWKKRHTKARQRADAHRLRVRELEDAIAAWLVGDLCEDGLAAYLTTSNGPARKPVRASASGATGGSL